MTEFPFEVGSDYESDRVAVTPTTRTAHAVLRGLFRRFNGRDITYVVPRKYEFLPVGMVGDDVDLYVAPEDFATAIDSCDRTGFTAGSGAVGTVQRVRTLAAHAVHDPAMATRELVDSPAKVLRLLRGRDRPPLRVWRNAGSFDSHIEEAHRILNRVGLKRKAGVTARNLSHGEKRQLEVAIALAGDPDVLLLDEPNAGVSSESVDEIIALIEDVATDHAVLLVEHNMEVVMNVSNRIVVLNQGAVIADDRPEGVRDDPAVQEAYLGGYEPGAGAAASDDAADPEGSVASESSGRSNTPEGEA